MRGKAKKALAGAEFTGITPAYAGKRLKRSHKIVLFRLCEKISVNSKTVIKVIY